MTLEEEHQYAYQVNEGVLCFHGPLIYEAKVLKRDCWTEDSGKPSIGIQYFVHYKGWKDKWDEWVPETRVLKLNEENLERQKILMQAHKPAPVSAISKRSSDKSSSSSKKRDSLATQSTIPLLEENGESMKLAFTDTLKCLLVDEWENITKKQLILSVPARQSIRQILEAYKGWVQETNPFQIKMHSPVSVPVNILNPKNVNLRASLVAEQLANHGENSSSDKVPTSEKNSETMAMNPFTLHMQVVEEVIDGIMEYFNLSLGALLLYSTERLQYKHILSQLGQQTILPSHMADSECVPEHKELVDLYGSHHLLRLFTKLPEMISKLPMATGTLSLLKEHFTMILKYLDIFAPHLFQEDADYCNLSPDQILQLKSIQ